MNDQPPALRVTGPLSLGELLDRTILLSRRAWRPLLLVSLLGLVPAVLYNLLVPPTVAPFSLQQFLLSVRGAIPPINANGFAFFYLIAKSLLEFLVSGALVMIASQAILAQPIRLRTALEVAWGRFGAIWGTNFVAGLGVLGVTLLTVLVGLLAPHPVVLVLVPTLLGLLLNLLFSLKNQALLLEELPGGSQPIGRSISLIRARFWPSAGFFLLLSLGINLVSAGWGALITLLADPAAALLGQSTGNFLYGLVILLPQLLTSPLMTVGVTLLYYDLRIRLEGLDLDPTVTNP